MYAPPSFNYESYLIATELDFFILGYVEILDTR